MANNSKKICWFTGVPAEISTAHDQDEKIIISDLLDRYQLSHSLGFVWQQESGSYTASQAKVNCARKCLEVKRENRKAIPYWVPRDKIEHYKEQIKDKPNFVLCCYEDISEQPVDHSQKPYLLLESLAHKLERTGAFAKFKISIEDQTWARIVDKNELWTILRYLADKKFIQQTPVQANGISELVDNVYNLEHQMLVGGWEALATRNRFPNSKNVFIATQFNWPGEDALNEQAMAAIKAACASCGYEASVVGQNHTGNITDQIIAEIKKSRFVVAELTYNNRGVYFESGFARGLGVPVFHLVRDGFTDGKDEEGKRIHFDIQQVMFRKWKTPQELETTLRDWIEATVGKYND